MNDTLYNQILEWIPSNGLKKAIREGERCSDLTMLSAAYHCAPDFEARLDILEKFSAEFDGELKKYAEKLRRTESRKRERFIRPEAQTIYELNIRERPEMAKESFLCTSYEAALMHIKRYYEYYECEEEADVWYSIEKRCLFAGEKIEGDTLRESIATAILKRGGLLKSVSIWQEEGFDSCHDDCDGGCDDDCVLACIKGREVKYPAFAQDGDAVRYIGWEDVPGYGVVRMWEDLPERECYIIQLDSMEIMLHDFENDHYAHIHVGCPFVEVISADELPENLREPYRAYAEFIREQKKKQSV